MRRFMTVPLCLLLITGLTACDKAVDRSRVAVSTTQRAFGDAVDVWGDLFTYHPPAPPQAPQTRYCYKMSSDIVCYDSVQPQLTAKLYGYQDGNRMSWVQPGGGSLGASGGEPVALSQNNVRGSANVIAVTTPIENSPVASENANARTGEIQAITLSPKK